MLLEIIISQHIDTVKGDGGATTFYTIIKDALIPLAAAFIGAASAYWIYKKQLKDKLEEEEKKRKEIRKNELRYFASLIDGITTNVQEQITSYIRFNRALKIDPFFSPAVPKSILTEFERLSYNKNLNNYLVHYLEQFGNKKVNLIRFKNIIHSVDELHTLLKITEEDTILNLFSDSSTRNKLAATVTNTNHYIGKLNFLYPKNVTLKRVKQKIDSFKVISKLSTIDEIQKNLQTAIDTLRNNQSINEINLANLFELTDNMDTLIRSLKEETKNNEIEFIDRLNHIRYTLARLTEHSSELSKFLSNFP